MSPNRKFLRLVLLVAMSLAAALVVAGPAHAAVPGNDAVANAADLDLTAAPGGTAQQNPPTTSLNDATATDPAADDQLNLPPKTAANTIWYQLTDGPDAAPLGPGRVTITLYSPSGDDIVAGVMTTTTPLTGTTDEFDLMSNPSVFNNGRNTVAGGNVAGTDDHTTRVETSGSRTSTLSFSTDSQVLTGGQNAYYLGVGSLDGGGSAKITVSYAAAPGNDDFANATPLATGPALTGSTTGSTPELDGGTTDLDPEPIAGDPSMFSVWFSYTAPSNGLVTLDFSGTDFKTQVEICQSSVPSAADCALNPLVQTTATSNPQPTLTFNAGAGQVYYVFLDGKTVTSNGLNDSGGYKLKLTADAAPANDDISTPTVLKSTGDVSVKGTNIGASDTVLGANPPASTSTEASHGLTFNGGATHTVWYSYTPKKSATVVISTSGSLDTDLEVFTGNLSKGFTDTGVGNDNYAPGLKYSWVSMKVKKGTTYTIGVDGAAKPGYPQGNFGLAVGAVPSNDNLANATFLKKKGKSSAASGKVKGSTQFATLEKGETFIKKQEGVDTWYTFVAPKAGKYTFTESLSGGGLAALGLYSGKGHDALKQKLVKYTAAKKAKPVSVKVKAKAGQQFSVEVSGVKGSVGKYTLSWK